MHQKKSDDNLLHGRAKQSLVPPDSIQPTSRDLSEDSNFRITPLLQDRRPGLYTGGNRQRTKNSNGQSDDIVE